MITQKIVCDNCGQEQKDHVYFVMVSGDPVLFVAALDTPNVPDDSATVMHVCGDRCLMNMLSEWMMRTRNKRNTDDAVGSSN